MSYATTSDIQGEFKNITFSGSTAVTSTQVSGFLTDADAMINARLAPKYQVPITGSNSLVIVKLIAIKLVKHRILEIIKVKTGKTSEDQDSQGKKTLEEQAFDLINDIVKDKLLLTDATLATTADGVRSYSNDNADSIPYVFQRGSKQW